MQRQEEPVRFSSVLRWPLAPLPPSPGPGEVVLVCAPLDLPEEALLQLRASLSPAEQERAARFATPQLASRWAAGRGLLRALLARATGAPARALRFTEGPQGKPALDPACLPPDGPRPSFNVSHSRGLGLFALGKSGALGVDLERVAERQGDRVAERFFHPDECAFLRGIASEEERRAAFFTLWSCKEAFIKATGRGLSQGLQSFCFALDAGGPRAVRWHRDDPEAERRWQVHRLDPAVGFRAALVAEAGPLRLCCCGWDPGAAAGLLGAQGLSAGSGPPGSGAP